jgi:hypothetical protein
LLQSVVGGASKKADVMHLIITSMGWCGTQQRIAPAGMLKMSLMIMQLHTAVRLSQASTFIHFDMTGIV